MLLALSAVLCLGVVSSASAFATQNSQYGANYGAAAGVDQAAYSSPKFWAQVDAALPGLAGGDPELERFRGFVHNIKTGAPGEKVLLESGQELLSQYVYPGLADGVGRAPYPAASSAELTTLIGALHESVAPVAVAELDAVLAARPLLDDSAAPAALAPAGSDSASWERAAWFGWQFLSLRCAKEWMPRTVSALTAATVPAHRFVGIARQRAACRGTLHSDGRNYMLSTLTPLRGPAAGCGIVVAGETAPLAPGGAPLVVDNTFPHFVFNDHASDDRFVLMTEVWHPALRPAERTALATLFAVKDRFTVCSLGMAPWGYSDGEIEAAVDAGVIFELDFWRDFGHAIGAAPTRRRKDAPSGGVAGGVGSKPKSRAKSRSAKKPSRSGFGK